MTSSSSDRPDCRCGHLGEAHQHLRRGTDCALCDCPRYRPEGGWPAVALRALRDGLSRGRGRD